MENKKCKTLIRQKQFFFLVHEQNCQSVRAPDLKFSAERMDEQFVVAYHPTRAGKSGKKFTIPGPIRSIGQLPVHRSWSGGSENLVAKPAWGGPGWRLPCADITCRHSQRVLTCQVDPGSSKRAQALSGTRFPAATRLHSIQFHADGTMDEEDFKWASTSVVLVACGFIARQ